MRLGVCYFPEHWPSEEWERDVAAMADAGLEYVRMAEFSWGVLEPERGTFDFEWFDEAIELIGDHGMQAVLCTPTATPPKWLVDERPSIRQEDPDGTVREHGSRRHYCFNSDAYREGRQLGSSSGSPSDTPTRRTSPAGRRTTSSAVTRPSGVTATIVPTRSERGSRTGTVILTDSTRRGERVLEPAVRLLRRNRSAWADPCRASPLAAAGVRTLFQRFRRRVQSPPRRPDTRG